MRLMQFSFYCLLILLFSSCTSSAFKKRSLSGKSSQILNKGMEKICLSGEGKGRISLRGERQSFQFESLLNRAKKLWATSYHFPLHGEESLFLNYNQAFKGGIGLEGSLYQKLISDMDNLEAKQELEELFYTFFLKLGQFLEIYENLQFSPSQSTLECIPEERFERKVRGQCLYGPHKDSFIWETSKESFTFSFPLNKRGDLFNLHFNREKKEFFSKWTASLKKGDENGFNFKVETYIVDCVRS